MWDNSRFVLYIASCRCLKCLLRDVFLAQLTRVCGSMGSADPSQVPISCFILAAGTVRGDLGETHLAVRVACRGGLSSNLMMHRLKRVRFWRLDGISDSNNALGDSRGCSYHRRFHYHMRVCSRYFVLPTSSFCRMQAVPQSARGRHRRTSLTVPCLLTAKGLSGVLQKCTARGYGVFAVSC